MKRFVSVLAIAGILLAGTSSAFAGGRYYHNFPRHHYPRGHYVHSGDHIAALGFGILAGVIISDLIYQPQPVVVYGTPATPTDTSGGESLLQHNAAPSASPGGHRMGNRYGGGPECAFGTRGGASGDRACPAGGCS